MKLKELMPLVGTDEVIILIPQDLFKNKPALNNYLADEGGLERIDTVVELGILLRSYKDHIIANLTPESVNRKRDNYGKQVYSNTLLFW